MDRDTELQKRLELLDREDAGQLDALRCPECAAYSVAVWYTRPADHYFTWFICPCGYHFRAGSQTRPRHYAASRDRTGKPFEPQHFGGTFDVSA